MKRRGGGGNCFYEPGRWEKVCLRRVRPHPGPAASQAHHKMDAPNIAPLARSVVPQERGVTLDAYIFAQSAECSFGMKASLDEGAFFS